MFKGPDLRCEIFLELDSSKIVWSHGPFPASKPDLVIIRSGMKIIMSDGERTVADKGHNDRSSWTYHDSNVIAEDRVLCADLRARHETLKRRL